MTISSLQDNLDTCVLDAEGFEVTSVKADRSGPLEFEHSEGSLSVQLDRPYAYRDTVAFTVSYFAENVNPDHKLDGIDFREATEDNPPIIEAFSWPGGARRWFPCYDHPNDKVTSEVIATVKSDYKVLSNGRLVSETQDKANGTRTFHWSQEQPHSTYLFMLAAGPYEVLSDSLGDLPINYWVYKKDVTDAMRSFEKTPKILDFFNREYDVPYPWIKYDQITTPGTPGGMENTNATTLTHHTIHDERAEQDFPSHWLVAHEAAHQWWGDLVTMRDWSHAWLSESFATYGEYLFAQFDLGADEGAVNLLGKKKRYLREAENRYLRPIVFDRWETPQNLFDSHLYPKGAVVLNMLRFVMGDEPFRRAMSHFLRKHAYGTADTYDLTTAIKEATGQNLDWFFEQWILRPGHPVFEIVYHWNADLEKLKLEIKQTQRAAGVPVFEMPFDLAVTTEQGKALHRLWLRQRVDTFELDVAKQPLLVRFDEGNYLLKEWTFEKTREELLYQLKHDDVIGRAWAAKQLGERFEIPEVVAELKASATDDPFWFVRQNCIEALGELRDKSLITFFKERALDDKSTVRVAALEVLGAFAEAELVPFFKKRFEEDDSYRAQAEAIRSLGKCGDATLNRFFERAARMDSPRDVVKQAAEEALAKNKEST